MIEPRDDATRAPAAGRRKARVLVVDDDPHLRENLRDLLVGAGHASHEVAGGQQALDVLQRGAVDVVLLDLRLDRSRLSGMDVLRAVAARHPDVPVVIVSGEGTIHAAVEATRLGAYDFLEKPVGRERILLTVRNAFEKVRLQRDRDRLLDEAREPYQMIGGSAAMRPVYRLIGRAARTESRVLITGESGVGKEVVARAIHHQSARAGGPFCAVNCAAIPGELIESELFGHEQGAFTGATRQRVGTFERADGGTLFLDEVGDMSLGAQAKVLRALQETEITRVGGAKPVEIDVRVVAATNKTLTDEIEAGRFREDLYYRLNVIPVHVPPLRDRPEDVPALVEHFLLKAGLPLRQVAPDAQALLAGHEWPGNVRELQNVVERLVALGDGDAITADDVTDALVSARTRSRVPRPPSRPRPALSLHDALAAFERRTLVQTLIANGWSRQQTAAALGIDRTHLWRKMKQHGIEEPPPARAASDPVA